MPQLTANSLKLARAMAGPESQLAFKILDTVTARNGAVYFILSAGTKELHSIHDGNKKNIAYTFHNTKPDRKV